jgi:hypothetical protein
MQPTMKSNDQLKEEEFLKQWIRLCHELIKHKRLKQGDENEQHDDSQRS